MVKVKSIKSDNMVTPHEYIDDDNNVVLAMHVARDKYGVSQTVYKTNAYEVRVLPKDEFLVKFEYCISEVSISVKPDQIERDPPREECQEYEEVLEEDEIHRDEELDVFKAFQKSNGIEIGSVEIDLQKM